MRAPILGASVAGPGHARAGVPCQDAYAWTRRGDLLLVAVADGLGSAARADVGSARAVAAAVEGADGQTPCDLVVAMVERARRALETTAAEGGCALADLACTLIAVACGPDGAWAAHVGDGAAVVDGADGLGFLSRPERSEYSNEVRPLTGEDWRSALRTAAYPIPVRALAIFTDGCQPAAIRPDGAPHAGFFEPVFAFAAETGDGDAARDELASLLAGRKMSEHSDDDKTLVVAVM